MLKNVELIFEGNSFSCELKPESKDSIICNIYQNGLINFEGKITLKDLYSQIKAFEDYSIEELFTILKDIEKDKFEMINFSDKYNLKISIQVLKKEKELNIPLEKKSHSNTEIIQFLLNEVKIQQKQIAMLEKELLTITRTNKKKEKENKEKENKGYYFCDIDITKMKIQRKKNLAEEGSLVNLIKRLEGGRIAACICLKYIAIIDPESLETVFTIKEPCQNFLELEKDIIALILQKPDSNGWIIGEQILLIKLEEKNYTVLAMSYGSSFGILSKLLDGTLITPDYENNEICFFNKKSNLTDKDFSIKFKNKESMIHFIFQTKKNEIIYDEKDEIIFYDFVAKKEIKTIKLEELKFYSFNSYSRFEMISDELLCITNDSLLSTSYSAYLININKHKLVKIIPLREGYEEFRAIYPIKGKYLITISEEKMKNIKNIKQFKVEADNISLMHELEINDEFLGIIFLNNGKNGKFIAHDNCNIYELY